MASSGAAEWLDGQVDRLLADQRARADTAKLVVTFALAVSAALVGVAAQTDGVSHALVTASAVTFGVDALLLVAVFLLDRVLPPDDVPIVRDQSLSPSGTLRALRHEGFAAVARNEPWVGRIKAVSWVALLLAVGTWALCVVALVGRS